MNIIEKSIALIDPGWALNRAKARVMLDAMGTYRQLLPSRDRAPLPARTTTEDREFRWLDRLKVIDACRRMARENSLMAGIINTFVTNVVGQGIRPIPASGDAAFDAAAASYFMDWAESPEFRGLVDFWDFQKIMMKTLLTDSDCGVILTDAGKIQGVEGDCIQTPAEFAPREGYSISQGVQYHPVTGEVERYWTMRRSNARNFMFDQSSARGIDVRYFAHVAEIDRFSSYRGITPAFSALEHLQDLDDICDFTKFAFKVQSLFAIALTGGDENSSKPGLSGFPAASADGSQKPAPQIDLQKGVIIDAKAYGAKDIKALAPTSPGPQFEPFANFVQSLIGRSFGLPLDLVTMRLHEGNFSSQRMVFRVSMKTFLQKWKVLTAASQKIYAWKINRGIIEGRLRPGRDCKYPAYARWSLPIPEVADPKDEVIASLWSEIAGYTDKETECLSRGRDRKEVAEKQAEIMAEMERMKLPFLLGPVPGLQTMAELNAKIGQMEEKP